MLYHVTFPGGSEVKVEVLHLPTGELSVTVDGKKLGAETLSQAASSIDGLPCRGPLAMRIDGRVVDLWMEGAPPGIGVIARGRRFYATVESERARALSAAIGGKDSAVGEGTVVSPMPGRVLKLLVQEGDAIVAGAPLVVVEAMKMENELVAGRDGTVKKIHVTPGQTVDSGARLVEVG